MKNLLITGANGQLGNEMRVLAEAHSEYTYHFTDIDELDILNEAAVHRFIAEHQIDIVVNCAAYTAVDKAESDEVLAHRLNADAPRYLAEAIEQRGGTLIQVSTDYVFDGTAHTPYTEDIPTCPNSVYGRTKQEGEQAVLSACRKSVVIRTAWLYSTFGNNFVKTMIRLGNERDELGVIFDQVGTPTYARDLAQAIYAIIGMEQIASGIYHYSNEGVCSWYDFTLTIHRLSGITNCMVKPLHTANYPTAASRPHYSVLDKTKIKEIYGISIPHWQDSLTNCLALLAQQ